MKIIKISQNKPPFNKDEYPTEKEFFMSTEYQSYLKNRDKITKEQIKKEREMFMENAPEIGTVDSETGFSIEQYHGVDEPWPAYNLLEIFQKQKYTYLPINTSNIIFTPTQMNYLNITPTQLHVAYEFAQKYRTNPPINVQLGNMP
jgi:hypothetical protein